MQSVHAASRAHSQCAPVAEAFTCNMARRSLLRTQALHAIPIGLPQKALAPCAGVPGDGHTYAALTRGYAQAGDLQRALGILDHMVEAGTPSV